MPLYASVRLCYKSEHSSTCLALERPQCSTWSVGPGLHVSRVMLGISGA